MKCRWFLPLLLCGFQLNAQTPTPPCGDVYGNAQDEANIIQQMRFGSIADAQNAINQAKNTRGTSLGCPELPYNHNPGNYSQPQLSDVANIWNTVHLPAIESYTIDCPRVGRYENNAALGAYYAQIAGYAANNDVLYDIARMQMAQQYTSNNVTNLIPEHEGIYAYLNVPSSDPCYQSGVVGSSVSLVCANIPSFCVPYDYGLFAGENFLIGDQYEPLSFYDGGIAYDHGWIGVHLIEAAIQQNDPARKEALRESLFLAAQWAREQEVVKNHNYSAKLVWLLAQMYNWTDDLSFHDELNYKLDKNLLPSVLMDLNNDSLVDGTNPAIHFQDLTTVAKIPGRNWDGHNALPWYSAMNAWALTDAYVAFRDRGDLQRAQELKPYVIAMLDNLSWEINNLGVIDDQLGVRDLTYALLNGIWKVARYENESHPDWESAAWAMWNAGYFNTYTTHSVCVGLYLCILSNTLYEPPFVRETYLSLTLNTLESTKVFPNPTDGFFTIETNASNPMIVVILDLNGREVWSQNNVIQGDQLDVSSLTRGTYFIKAIDTDARVLLSEPLVIQ